MKTLFFTFVFLLGTSVWSVDFSRLQEYCSTPLPCWAEKQLSEDFSCFNSLSVKNSDLTAELDRLSSLTTSLLICSIRHGKIYFFEIDGKKFEFSQLSKTCIPRAITFFKSLQYLQLISCLPDGTFLIDFEDNLASSSLLPILGFAKKQEDPGILIPDFEALTGYIKLKEEIREGKQSYPFSSKIDKAFWRGSTTGSLKDSSHCLEDHWQELPRGALVAFSKKHRGLLDAKFTHVCQIEKKNADTFKRFLKKEDLFSSHVSIEEHFAYKYLIDIDGNSCTYSRLFWILSSNSLCLKQESNHQQWYYKALIPYQHYVPFKKDLSDLLEKIEWAKKNEEEVKRMIKMASDLSQEVFEHERLLAYLYQAIQRATAIYASCIKEEAESSANAANIWIKR